MSGPGGPGGRIPERVQRLAHALCRDGVKAVFGVPGSGASWQLLTALEERGVLFCGVGHEAAGAIMAGAFGRQSDTMGCSISIKGPGLANALPGILSNRYEQWAALSIAEAYDAGLAHRRHKRLDHRAVTAPVVKAYAAMGDDPERAVGRLLEIARAEIPGPVHLDLSNAVVRPDGESMTVPSALPSSPVWERVLDLVERAKRPAVIVGSLATRSAWRRRLGGLAVPVFTTVAAKGVLDEDSPWAAAVFTGEGKALAPERVVLPEADLIVGLGLRNLEVLTPRPFTAPLVVLDGVLGTDLTLGFEAAEVLAPAALSHFDGVLDRLSAKRWGADVVAESLAGVHRHLTRAEWLPASVFVTLQTRVRELGCLVVDTGTFCTVAEHLWRARDHRAFMASANGRYMGTALPMALGAALAERTKPTICVVGDGGVRPYIAEIKLAIEQKLPLLVLFMTDGRYGSLAGAPSSAGLTSRAITIGRPSWFEAIEALGCPAAQVMTSGQLEARLGAWTCTDGPLFLELVFEPERYSVMTEDLR